MDTKNHIQAHTLGDSPESSGHFAYQSSPYAAVRRQRPVDRRRIGFCVPRRLPLLQPVHRAEGDEA